MKKQFKKLLFQIVAIDPLWSLIAKTLIYPSQLLRSLRMDHEAERIIASDPKLREALLPRVVIGGPFEGMRYGDLEAHCSALHPKLLGVYELEISPFFQEVISQGYETIVDVGAAEGYYAIGLARKIPGTKVIAFEQEADAREELAALANLNQVAERIEIRQRCEPEHLMDLDSNGGLMIMDCEGYEENLLTPEVIGKLKKWDFIVETHDGMRPDVTALLEKRFLPSHDCRRIEIVNDLNRADHVKLDVLSNLNRRQKDRLLAEGRQHATVRWLACKAKC
jgi:hypothetical protein